MMLPKPVPVAATANANGRLFSLKYEFATDSGGMKQRPNPIPVKTPWASNNSQDLSPAMVSLPPIKLVKKVPATTIMHPRVMVPLTNPASAIMPETVQKTKARKVWAEPIHGTMPEGSCSVSI